MELEYVRNEVSEVQFRKRYNRRVEVSRKVIMRTPTKIDRVLVKILSPNKREYKLTDKLDDNQLTECAFVEYAGKTFKYNSYLEAEVHTADAIGAE